MIDLGLSLQFAKSYLKCFDHTPVIFFGQDCTRSSNRLPECGRNVSNKTLQTAGYCSIFTTLPKIHVWKSMSDCEAMVM